MPEEENEKRKSVAQAHKNLKKIQIKNKSLLDNNYKLSNLTLYSKLLKHTAASILRQVKNLKVKSIKSTTGSKDTNVATNCEQISSDRHQKSHSNLG